VELVADAEEVRQKALECGATARISADSSWRQCRRIGPRGGQPLAQRCVRRAEQVEKRGVERDQAVRR